MIYPPNWPLVELTAPMGSKRAELLLGKMSNPYYVDGRKIDDQIEYIIAYEFNGSFSDVLAHTENCLMDYDVLVVDDNSNISRSYLINDGKYGIFVCHSEAKPNIYQLEVTVFVK